MELGWIKIHRQILNWEWYDEPNTFRVFIHLLLKANHKPNKYRGVTIEAGQIMTGQDLLALELKLTRAKIRLALNNLKTTNEITINSSRKGTIIQIVNYENYQVTELKQPKDNHKTTTEQPDDNQRMTSNKNVNNEKNEKNEKKKEFEIFWNEYHSVTNKQKEDKVPTEKYWNKLSSFEKEKALSSIKDYSKTNEDSKYLKKARTYLSDKCFNNEFTAVKAKPNYKI